MAASAAFTVDFKNGSVSRSNSSTTFVDHTPRSRSKPTLGVSATISLSTRFFFVPAYVTVASASITFFG